MAHLALALLGPFQATLDGQPITALTADRLRALLAYLVVEAGREHSREALAGLFWPERSDQEALSALRYALSNLRRAIGDTKAQPPCLLITRHTVQFNRASDYWLDVNDITWAGREPGSPATIEQLSAAIALYRGEFLAGLTIGDSVAFEEWMLLKGEQFRRQALTMLQRLAVLHEQRGDYEPAAACTRQYLTLEPWDEAAHRRLMRLLALGGQRSAALAQYETCRQVLAGELGVEPEDDTIRLYESIRDGALASRKRVETATAAAPPDLLPAYSPPAVPLFVGREAELARLNQSLGLALVGQGRVVAVCGEAGSGKTALLVEFACQAMAAHADLLFAAGRGAAQAGIGDPYLPFREILGLLTGDVETGRAWGMDSASRVQRLRATLPVVVEALIEAGPGLLDTWVPGKPLLQRIESLSLGGTAWYRQLEALLTARRSKGSSPGRQGRLFEQVSRVLQSVARQQPLLLLLDDLQWADPDSVSLLFHLGRQVSGSRILIVCAYRPVDLALERGQRHPLQPVIHEFQREWGESVIDLDQAEGRTFVNAYLDSEPNRLDDKFRARLCQTVGGNPLFTVELLHRLQERGYLTRDTAGCWVAGSTFDWQRVPGRVEAIVAERLDRLPPEWRAMLDVASVVGEEFEAEVVARVLGVDERAVLRTLGGPLSKQQRLVHTVGLIQTPGGQRLSRYRFRHGLFQSYLYQELDEAERANLHEAVGNQLEALHQDSVTDLAPWLAWHFEAAGALDKAADYCLIAGNQAYQLAAHEEAIVHYRKGLALLNRLPPTSDPALRQVRMRRELDLHLGLGRPLGVTRGWASAEQTRAYERAYELAQELSSQGKMSPEFLLAFSSYVETMAAQGELQQALILSERLFALAQQDGGPLALGLARWLLGTSHLFRGEYVLGCEHLGAAVSLYRDQPARLPALAATDVGVTCLSWLSFALCGLGYPDQALARGREAIALARERDMPLSQGLALSVGGCGTHLCCRQPQSVEDYATELHDLARAKDLQLLREWVEIPLGWCQVERGEFEPGIARMSRGTRAWQQMGTVVGDFWHLSLLAEAHGKADQVDQGLSCIEEALALLRRVGYSQYEPELHRVQGELLRGGAEAEQSFWRAIETARRQESRWWELRATVSLARLWQTRGTPYRQRAREMLAGLVAWFSEGFDLPDLREAQVLLQELSSESEQN